MALGRLTEEGMGIEKDLQEAAGWYAKAGRLGTALDALQRLKNEHGITPSTMANPLPS
jgi:TPR repeat protein